MSATAAAASRKCGGSGRARVAPPQQGGPPPPSVRTPRTRRAPAPAATDTGRCSYPSLSSHLASYIHMPAVHVHAVNAGDGVSRVYNDSSKFSPLPCSSRTKRCRTHPQVSNTGIPTGNSAPHTTLLGILMSFCHRYTQICCCSYSTKHSRRRKVTNSPFLRNTD